MNTKDTYFSLKKTINCGGKLIDLSTPVVMGIINITPDSFYGNSRYCSDNEIITRVEAVLIEGGSIIDIGAYSSRPSAEDVSEAQERERLNVALSVIRAKFNDVVISVDTFRSSIAEWAVKEYGVNIINDISSGNMDANMFKTIAALSVPYIAMHMQGTPQNMQLNPNYNNIIKEVSLFFSEKIQTLKMLGVTDIIIDPGFGFGKTLDHNYQLLNQLDHLKVFDLPIMVGVSRKSMISKLLNNTPEEALNGTTVVNTIALMKGASILRVHDVKEAVEAVKIFQETTG